MWKFPKKCPINFHEKCYKNWSKGILSFTSQPVLSQKNQPSKKLPSWLSENQQNKKIHFLILGHAYLTSWNDKVQKTFFPFFMRFFMEVSKLFFGKISLKWCKYFDWRQYKDMQRDLTYVYILSTLFKYLNEPNFFLVTFQWALAAEKPLFIQ